MPRITALIHVKDDALRLGRTLDSLRPCDEVIVVDHASGDGTREVARAHGVRLLRGIPGVQPGAHAVDARNNWILCIQPWEAISEEMEASLLEWAETDVPDGVVGYSFKVRQESGNDWEELAPELRLVDRTKINWTEELPPNASQSVVLPGALLRFAEPSAATPPTG